MVAHTRRRRLRLTGTAPAGSPLVRRRWARVALLLVVASAGVVVAAASARGIRLLVEVALAAVVFAAAAYWFLARRGWARRGAAVLLVAIPVALVAGLVGAGLLLEVVAAAGLLALAVPAGWAALATADEQGMPERPTPVPARPWLVMNPRSGDGKVGRFRLDDRARRLGAEVVLLDPAHPVDVAALAREAVTGGANLLGVAGGDGTQALVAGVAADLDVPFVVLSAGTRNHFALDLGLDREDPVAGLAALSPDAVELRVDLGTVGGRTFVNNASFGAYAAVVQSPAYRDDKRGTTLDLLPDLLGGHRGPRLTVHAGGYVVDGPQAVLVSNNPYGMGDVAGIGRRARLDGGVLGLVTVTVDGAREAVGLLRGALTGREPGVVSLTCAEAVISADAPRVPAGVDGESLLLPTPVRVRIRPGALRVRVPRDRPGVPAHRPAWSLARLARLAAPAPRRSEAGR